MPKIVNIPGVGNVNFPDTMDPQDVEKEASRLYHLGPSSPQVGYQSPRYTGTGASPGMVASDQAAHVLEGIPEAITGIPSALKALGGTAWDAIRGRAGDVGKDLSGMASNIAAPFKTVGQGALELAAPGSTNAPPPESPEWATAARAGGAMLAGAELPNVMSGVKQALSPAFSRLRSGLTYAANKFTTPPPVTAPELNDWMNLKNKQLLFGKDPGAQIINDNLLGTDKPSTLKNVSSARKSVGAQMEPALDAAGNNGVRINLDSEIQDAIADAKRTYGKGNDEVFQKQLERLEDQFVQQNGDLKSATPKEVHAFEKDLGKGIDFESSSPTDLQKVMKDIRGRVDRALKTAVPDIVLLKDKWGNLYEGEKALQSAIRDDMRGAGTGSATPLNPSGFDRMKAAAKTGAKLAGKGALVAAGGGAAYKILEGSQP